ncbi:MAG: MarR family transcriptional regulator [Candidatus Aenigmarchaeota archaeon]|nr:MarR family transcriptional regulator [Candidatus Aenigmarchaeota archaeon]
MLAGISLTRKNIGAIIIIVSLFIFVLSYFYMDTVKKLDAQLHKDCDLPDEICPFKKNIPPEAAVGFIAGALTGFFGLFLFVSSPKEEGEVTERLKRTKAILSKLDTDEKKIYDMVAESGGIFQSEVVEKSGMSKVKITRLLDRLESKGVVERKRRGMTNIVVVKQ